MKAYILKVVGAALLATIAEIIVPEGWKGYIKLVCGFILMSVLILPLSNKFETSAFEDFQLDKKVLDASETKLNHDIKTEAEKNLAIDIENRISTEFSADMNVRVFCGTDNEGRVNGISKIKIAGKKNKDITVWLKKTYKAEEVIWIN